MEEIEVNARGMRFHGLTDGQEDHPLLLLLHGLPRNSWEWHHQISPMAEMGYRVVAHDLRGVLSRCPTGGSRVISPRRVHR